MQNLVEQFSGLLGGDGLARIAHTIGADEVSTGKGVAAAIPLFLSGLQTKLQHPTEAQSLLDQIGALNVDGILGDMGGLLSNPSGADGVALLNTVFGASQTEVEEKVARASGLTQGIVGRLLPLIAPVVLAFIARQAQAAGGALDAATLTRYVGDQQGYLRAAAPGLLGFLERMDANDDGSVLDDLGRLTGRWFGKKPAA